VRAFARVILVLMVGAAGALGGCGSEPPSLQSADAGSSVTVEQGPVRITATFSSDRITIAERIDCVVRVLAPADFEIGLPTIGETLGEYTVVESSVSPPRLVVGGLMEHRLSMLLEPFLPGAYEVDPLVVSVRERDAEEASDIALTLPVVTVVSVLDDSPESASIGELKPPLDPVEATGSGEAEGRSWLVAAAIGGGVLALVLVGVVLVARKRRARTRPDPCGEARARLEALASASDLPSDAVDAADDAVRVCLACTIEPAAAAMTASQLIESSNVRHALSSDDMDTLEHCLSQFDRMKYAPSGAAPIELQESVAQAARLASVLIASRDEPHPSTSNGHVATAGGQA
jgi:hypothetical protein